MLHTGLDRAHWPLWETYAEASEEARDLAYVLRIPITFKCWGNGWVIWNYKNLDRDRCNQRAEDHQAENRYQGRDDPLEERFLSGWYLWHNLEKLPEQYYVHG